MQIGKAAAIGGGVIRDDNLVAILDALSKGDGGRGGGAGALQKDYVARLGSAAGAREP